jgi:Bacterial Ig-like domain (group 1)
MRLIKSLVALILVAALAACGGGGGSAGTTGSGTGTGGGTGGGTTAPTVASFIYQLDKASITNAGSDKALLTVTALDANNNPVSGVSLSVAVDTGIYTPVSATTDSSGQASGNISIGANKANRNITAAIALGGQSATAVVAVTGSQISMTPVPATPAPGASMRVDIKVTDANGAGVPSVAVQLSGNLGFTGSVTTDSAGNASATLGATPATPGTYAINASALGVQATRAVQVVSGAGGGIPDAVGPISSPILAIVPNTIAPNSTGSTTNRASLKATFVNASNQAIQNVRVRFEIVPPALGSGETLSTGDATVYSDVDGNAIADYIAGTRSSPTNGVTIRACYGLTDAAIAGACPSAVTKTLTVASQPLSITLGDNNLLEKGNFGLTYIKKFDVAVADAAGNAVSNASVSASVDITHYGKGGFGYASTGIGGTGTYQITLNNPPNITNDFSAIRSVVPSPTTGNVWCNNEDVNRNGSLDVGDDDINVNGNGNGELEPRKADVILSFVGNNATAANGRMTIQVEYPQNVATWLAYTVKVTTNVAGSEGTDQKSYVTSYIVGDEKNGSFLTPPYGASSCDNPN